MNGPNPDEQHAVPPTMLDDVDGGLAGLSREVERLTREGTIDRPTLDWDGRPEDVVAQILRPGDELVIHDLERFRDDPRTPRGWAVVYDAPSFATLVKRLGNEASTTLWAQQRSTGAASPSITAVFDDHESWASAGWREHRARLEVRMDPDWLAWARIDRQGMDQVALAEFLKEQQHVIVDPPAAHLIDAITTFSTKRNVSFNRAVNLDSGETEFTYVDKQGHDAGTTTVPREMTISLRPFYGAPETRLQVWVRYRLDDNGLTFFLVRIRPDLAEEAAWQDVCGQVVAELGDEHPFPILQGMPPEPLRDRRTTR